MTGENRWKRPAEVPYPSVWRRFEGRNAFPNGKKPKFRVQDFTEDLMDDLVDQMKNHFLDDEPLCEALNFKSHEDAVTEMIEMWKDYTKHKLVLVCILENKEDLEDDSLPILVGCNMTGIMELDTPHEEVKSPVIKEIFDILEFASRKVNCFELYGVSEYLYALGLSVHRKYRGQGIGLEILKARFDMGRAVGLKLTVTVFTAIASQKLAERTGFKLLYELPYQDYKVNGKAIFGKIKTKTMKLMAARIE